MPVFPVASVRSSPLSKSADGRSLSGCFWSKGAGRAVLVGVQSSQLGPLAAPVTSLPSNAVVDDVLGRHTSASVTGVVWGLLGCRRDQFT